MAWRQVNVACCEGFRMTASRGDAACTGAVVRKPPMKMLWGGRRRGYCIRRRWCEPMESNPMQKLNDLSRSLTPLKPDGTLIAVIEMSLSSWLVAGIVPGIERQPLKKLEVDE